MNEDSIRLLRECEAGIKMGISALDDVMDDVKNEKLKKILMESKEKHLALEEETRQLLQKHNVEDKEPAVMAKWMSKVKSNVKLMTGDADANVADLITDGCDMGIKSLNRYLNQYPTADIEIKKFAGSIILEEEALERGLRPYL